MYKVKEIIIYERYVRNKRDQNDIALVHLERPLEFKGSVQPICLPATVSQSVREIEGLSTQLGTSVWLLPTARL